MARHYHVHDRGEGNLSVIVSATTPEPSKPKLLNRYHAAEVSLFQISIDELTPAADDRDRGAFDRSFDSVGGGDSKSMSNL
jgi:hypothetical protein